jgi:hypothetical protein
MIASIVVANGFHVLIFFEAKPSKAEALGRTLAGLIGPSRAEPGCRHYESFADIENSAKFTVIEGLGNTGRLGKTPASAVRTMEFLSSLTRERSMIAIQVRSNHEVKDSDTIFGQLINYESTVFIGREQFTQRTSDVYQWKRPVHYDYQ